MKRKKLLVIVGLLVYSIVVLLVMWIALYYLLNAKPNLETSEEVANSTPTIELSGSPSVVLDEPAECHPNCSLNDLEQALAPIKQVDQYTVRIILGFDCLGEYERNYYGANYEETLVSSNCNPDQVGKKVRVVDGIRYLETGENKWEEKTGSEIDYFSLKQLLPQSTLADVASTYKDAEDETVYYQDYLNQGFDLLGFGYGQPDYEYYVFRKEGTDHRCITDEYDLFLQKDPEQSGDLNPSKCANYVWFFNQGLKFLEYRTLGFEFKAIFKFSNFGNTQPVEKPI